MKKVHCGIMGAGWWATTAHIPALKKHPGAEVVAVQTRTLAKSQKIAHDFGIAHACTSLEEVLAVKPLDAVIISSTPNMHYAQAKAALEQGLHVLIEKPMTITAKEAEELVELAKKRNLHFVISCPWHYTEHATEARKLIQSGALGQIKMISVLMTNFTDGLFKGLPWEKAFGDKPPEANSPQVYLKPGQTSYSDPQVAGGGQIYCQISHVAAHVAFLTHGEPAEMFARFDNGSTGVDVYDLLNFKLTDGTLVSIASTGATMTSERNYEVRIYGTEGMILMDLWKGTMAFHNAKGQVNSYRQLEEAEIYPMYAPAENLVNIIQGTAPNGSPASLGLTAMKVIESACRSAHANTNIIL